MIRVFHGIPLPFIAALIGWITNWVAIKMLFHPKKRIKIGIFEIQGIFPKRQKIFAEKLEELLNSIMKKEFRFVEILGGVLGFIIGLIQVILVNLYD